MKVTDRDKSIHTVPKGAWESGVVKEAKTLPRSKGSTSTPSRRTVRATDIPCRVRIRTTGHDTNCSFGHVSMGGKNACALLISVLKSIG